MTTEGRPRRQQSRRRRPQRQRSGAGAGDIWSPPRALPDAEPIVPARDPTALLRSLGNLSLPGQGVATDHYIAAIVERGAAMAGALAAAAEILSRPPADDDADSRDSGDIR